MVKIMNIKYRLFNYLRKIKFTNILSDKTFLKILYFVKMEKKLDLENPQTYSEKLQWLKLHDRNPEYTKMVDKYEAKEYVRKIIGDQYIIPTIGIYNSFDEINFDELPNQFVIKCTHDSGGLVIVKDKNSIDLNSIKRKINTSLRRNYYYSNREWPSENVKPRIIIEKYMEDKKSAFMKDYKFFCFDGVPVVMYLSEGLENHNTARMSFFDMNFQLMDFKRRDYKLMDYTPDKPKNFDKMKEFASILSQNIPHVRVDFYEINGNLYFGELTFFTCSGLIPFENPKSDVELGKYIKINK